MFERSFCQKNFIRAERERRSETCKQEDKINNTQTTGGSRKLNYILEKGLLTCRRNRNYRGEKH